MSRIFTSLFGKSPASSDGWTQVQREALIDLLVFAMYADRHLSLAEDRVLGGEAAALGWEGPGEVEAYLDRATERVRNLRATEDGRDNLLASIRERLDTPTNRERAFALCQALLGADGRTADEEAFADQCRKGLGL